MILVGFKPGYFVLGRPSRFPKTCSLCSPRQLAWMRMLRGVLENFHTTSE